MQSPVELVFFIGCPHVDTARARLRTALEAVGRSSEWREWDSQAPETPEDRRRFGSPTVLVDGSPVGGSIVSNAAACVLSGAPSVADLVHALRESVV